MEKSKFGVHEVHCCAIHGCKYNDVDCPVVSKETKQKYICELCDDDGIENIKQIEELVDFLERMEKR